MTEQELFDKIIEIKQIAKHMQGVGDIGRDNITRINQICSDIELEWKIENAKCLND